MTGRVHATQWYRQVQFISAVPMPEQWADELGTTVNGMWAAPEMRSPEAVTRSHDSGRRVLFSVPLIALAPNVYRGEAGQRLLREACQDIDGGPARVGWYYWEPEPVYSACIYSPVFRSYLLDRCKDGIERGMDVVNLDEINTSIGLMTRKAGGSGFCRYCLERFRGHDALATSDDEALRLRLKLDDALYARYRRFHELEAFGEVLRFIDELRAYAARSGPDFAITANVAYLGNNVGTHGALWGPLWGEHLDFLMLENSYRVPETGAQGPHLLLPRGKFTAWYRLAAGFTSRAPAWICPGILVPRQLAGQERTGYYLLMFLEAYANGGRWAYNWWPGADDQARYSATVPPRLKDYIEFIATNREFFERAETSNDLAILYLDSCISQKPAGHRKYLALAQALAETGYQYDVLYVGDGRFNPAWLDPGRLTRYKAVLIPEAGSISDGEADALAAYSTDVGGQVVIYGDAAAVLGRREDERPLLRFWRDYSDADRQRIAATVNTLESARVTCSDPMVNVIRWTRGGEGGDQILHLLNYNYDAATDDVRNASGLTVHLPWPRSRGATCTLLRPGHAERLDCTRENGQLVAEVPELDSYGLMVVRETG
jgi:hypothetical protein